MGHDRPVPRLPIAVAAATALLALSARADDLPPRDAPPYTGTYTVTKRQGIDDVWSSQTDTVTIAVFAKQSRWDYRSDGRTTLIDPIGRSTVEWGGKMRPGTTRRSRLNSAPIGWEFGYAKVAEASPAPPQRRGTSSVAGRPCMRLAFTSEVYGKPEYCVGADCIVLRFSNTSEDADATYEATSITPGTPDAARFTPPGSTP